MDFFEAVKRRSSVREYASTPVARGDLEKIIDCARLSPTARGEEPWEFVVVTDKEKIKELGEMTDHGKFLSGDRRPSPLSPKTPNIIWRIVPPPPKTSCWERRPWGSVPAGWPGTKKGTPRT